MLRVIDELGKEAGNVCLRRNRRAPQALSATGATLAELMARLGHSTASAAMRYQHAAGDRDKVIAAALSELATVTPITAAKSARPTKGKQAAGS